MAATRAAVSVGCFSGFWGDSTLAAAQLTHGPRLDYLVGDYLAELTMGLLARRKERYIGEFVTHVFRPLWPALAARGTRLVTNAGGLDPRGLRAQLEEVARAHGWRVRVAAVVGDDVGPQLPQWLADGRVLPFGDEGAA